MEAIIKPIIIALVLAAVSGLLSGAEPSPSDKSPLPAGTYLSAFEGYRPLIDEPMRAWRDANDDMGRLGGHIGHIGRDSAAPAPADAGNRGSTAPPVPGKADSGKADAHSGHHR